MKRHTSICQKDLNWYFQYQFLCDYTHSAFNNLNPLVNYTRGMLLSHSALIGAHTLYEYRQFLNPGKEQDHRIEAEFIKSLFDQLEKDGSFAALQWDE